MDIATNISRLLADPALPVTKQWLDEARQQCPSFILPALLYLQRGGAASEDGAAVLAWLATACSSRKQLALLLNKDMAQFTAFYPPLHLPAETDTSDTINRFLGTYGNSDDRETQAINNAIFNPTPDYADILAAEQQQVSHPSPEAKSADDALIDKFIAESKEKQRITQEQAPPQPEQVGEDEKAEIASDTVAEPVETDNSTLTESLAKMYIARRKYGKALEIIQHISLKNPEKSIYFADQIRFLRKLALNQQALNKNKET